MHTRESEMALLKLLAARLERLSADSHWAHRASGVRGQVLRVLDKIETDQGTYKPDLRPLVKTAFEILRKAAMEIS
jgi:hypothetical protein